MNDYVCKIPDLDEVNKKWDYEILNAIDDKEDWIFWKQKNVENYKNGKIIPCYGILNGKIICECTASIDSSVVQNSPGLVDENTAYLSAFRTIEEYQGKGYFSKLFKYMISDLKRRGFKKVTLGVEPTEEKNKKIYYKYGFNELVKKSNEIYPDGTLIEVEYYIKGL